MADEESIPVGEIPDMTSGLVETAGVKLSDLPSNAYAFPKKKETDLQTTQLDSGPQKEDAFAPVALYGGEETSRPLPKVRWRYSNALSRASDTSGASTGALQSQISAGGLQPDETYTQPADGAPIGEHHTLAAPDDVTVPTAKEARALHDQWNETLPQFEKSKIEQRLQLYFDHQKDVENEKHMDYLDDLTNPDKPEVAKELANRPEIKAALDMYREPAAKNLLMDRIKLNAYLDALAGRHLEDGAERDAFRNAWGQSLTGKPSTGITDGLGLMRKQMDLRRDGKVMEEEMYSKAATDYIEAGLEGKPPDTLAAIKKFQAKYPGLITQKNQSLVYQQYEAISRMQAKAIEAHRPQIFTLYNLATKMVAGTEDDLDVINAQDALRNIPSADRQRALQIASMAVRTNSVDRAAANQVVHNLVNVLSRGTKGYATSAKMAADDVRLEAELDGLKDFSAKIDNQGNIILYDPQNPLPNGVGRVPTDDERKALIAQRQRLYDNNQINREVKANYEQNLDPYVAVLPSKFLKKLEIGFYNIAEQAPSMAISALGMPFGGAARVAAGLVSFANYSAFYYNQIKTENPEMKTGNALALGSGMAAIESITDQFELGSIAGHGANKITALMSTLRTGGAMAFIKKSGIAYTEQNIEEGVQDLLQTVLQTFVSQQGTAGMERQEWGDQLKQWLQQRPEVAAMLVVPGLVGGGFATWRHLKDPERSVYNKDVLSRMGITKEWQHLILGETDKDKRDGLFREASKHATKESKAEAAKLIAGDLAEMGYAPDDVPKATREANVDKDGNRTFSILGPTGSVMHEGLNEDVAEKELAKINENLAAEHLAKQGLRSIGEEAAAKHAEAGAAFDVLDEEGKAVAATSPAASIDFEKPGVAGTATAGITGATAAAPDAALTSLQTKVASHPDAKGVTIREVIPSEEQSMPAGKAVMTAIKTLKSWTGTNVRFVESSDKSELFFHGVVDPSHPDTIWIDARGSRATLAIFGHEFAHSLEKRNPQLFAQLKTSLLPHIKDLAGETAKLKAIFGDAYKEGKHEGEYLANVMGDALSHPEMLERIARADKGLFQKIISAIKDWFQEFKNHAISTFGTEGGVAVEAVRNEIFSTLEKIKAAPVKEEGVAVGAESELEFARRKKSEEESKATSTLREDAEAARHKMDIVRQAREVAAVGHYSDEERAKVEGQITEQLDKMKGVPKHGAKRDQIEAEMRRQVEDDIRDKRMNNPDKVEPKTEATTGVTSPWAHVVLTGVGTKFEPKGGNRKKDFVKAYAKWKGIPFTFDKLPAGVTYEQHAENLANQMVNEFFERLAKGGRNADVILEQIGWYENVIGKLRHEYGGFSDMFADFLGGFSPATGVRENWKNAVGFLEQVVNGKYDALFQELHAWVESGKTIKQWRDTGKPIPLKENDITLFGSNTNNGLAAVLKMWRLVKEGDAPKARNFTRNLIGLSIKATIDRWAARMLQRLSGGERIPIGHAEMGVTGVHAYNMVQPARAKKAKDVVVTVDVGKLDEAFAKEPGFYIGKGGAGGIGTRYQQFIDFARPGIPVEMPEVSLSDSGVSFVNGRHRFAVMRDQGNKTIQLSVPADQAEAFQERFGASDLDISKEIPATGQFGLGQEVFKRAAAKMSERDPARFKDLLPSSMQAMNWFVEKEYWSEMNWTSKEGEGGSFEEMIAWQNAQRFVIGLTQAVEGHPTQPDFAPNTLQNVAFGNDLRADLVQTLKRKGQFLAVRAKDSVGMFERKPERTLDTEILTGMDVEPMDMIRIAAKHAGAKFQKSTFVARVIKDHEKDNPNARPGIEVYFDHEVSLKDVQPVMDYLVANGLDGFTMIVDSRSRPNPDAGAGGPKEVWGVRMMYIPEYAGMTEAKQWAAEAATTTETIRKATREVMKLQGVAHALLIQYDTIVLNNGTDYDEQGIRDLSIGGEHSRSWRERFINANAQATTDQHGMGGEERPAESNAPVSDRGEGRAPPESAGTDEGLSYSLRPGKMSQAAAEGVDRPGSIQAIFEAIHGDPTRKAELISRAYQLWKQVSEKHEAAQAAYQPPEVPNLEKALADLDTQEKAARAAQDEERQNKIDQAEAEDSLEREQIGLDEQAEIDKAYSDIVQEFGGRIADEADPAKKRALERLKSRRASTSRKVIEAVYAERLRGLPSTLEVRKIQAVYGEKAKALAADFTAARQAVRQKVRTAQLGSTAAGTADMKRMQRVQTFAELNAILRSLPRDIRAMIPPTPSLEGMTNEALTTFLGERLKQIGGAIENNLQRSFIDSIETMLEKAKPKKVSGKPTKGRIGDAQEVVNMINQVKDLSSDALANLSTDIERRLTEASNGGTEDSAALQQRIILDTFGGLGDMSAAQLERAHVVLKTILAQGRAQWAAIEQARLNRQNSQADMIVGALGTATSGDVVAMRRAEAGGIHGKVVGLKGWANSHYNFAQMLSNTLPINQLPFLNDWIERARKADSATEDYKRGATDRLTETVRTAIGGGGPSKTGAAIRDLQKPQITGRDRNPISKLEAIQYLLSWAQGDVADRMVRNGWTQDHIDSLVAGTNDSVSQAVMAFLKREYAANWAVINPVYKRMYGIDMPRIPNYAPTRYSFTGQEQDINPFGGPTATSGMTPGFVVGRVKHDNDLRQEDALYTFMQHMTETAHFVQYAELIREMRGTISRADVKNSLEANMGSVNYSNLKGWLEALQRKGSSAAAESMAVRHFIQGITTAQAVSSMVMNPRTWTMQFDSLFRWTMEIPMTHWLQTVFDIRTLGNVATAWNSDTVQRRVKEGMTPDMQMVMKQYDLTPTKMLGLVRAGFYPIRILDGAFTTLSSAAVYTYHYKQQIAGGASEADANAFASDKMDAAVHRFSQPTSLTAKPLFAVGAGSNSLFKMVTMFMSDPMLKTSLVIESANTILSNTATAGDKAMAFQRIGMVVAMGVMTQLVSNIYRELFTDDDKEIFGNPMEFVSAAALAPFQGLFLVGTVIESLYHVMMGEFAPVRGLPLSALPDRLHRTWKNLDQVFDVHDPLKMTKEWDDIIKSASMIPGLGGLAPFAALTNVGKPLVGAATIHND